MNLNISKFVVLAFEPGPLMFKKIKCGCLNEPI